MKRLSLLLKEFDGRGLNEELLTCEFEKIAKSAIYGGHFRVNDDFDIYIHEIEFYFHSENESESNIYDWAMYHRGPNVDYFPVVSLHPHRSGIDVTFEREGAYRASFLIRIYKIGENIIKTPSYLCEDLIGYTGCIMGDGPRILWVDDQYDNSIGVTKHARVNVRAYDKKGNPLFNEQGDKQYDMRLWRFSKIE